MVQIAYITDIHLDEQFPRENGIDARKNWALILDDVKRKGIHQIIFGGDIGEVSAYGWFFQSLHPYQLRICLGNHDKFADVLPYFQGRSSSNMTAPYSYEDAFLKYIFLDSSSNEISEQQLQWLQSELITTKKILLFIHHPVLPIDTYVDTQYPLLSRERMTSVLLAAPVEVLVYCAHYHMTDEQRQGNLTQIVTPAASFQIEKTKGSLKINTQTFGYRVITIDRDKVDSEVLLFRDGHFKPISVES